MKKLLIIPIIILLLVSCKKNDNKEEVDYREKYCGIYEFSIYSLGVNYTDTNWSDNYDTSYIVSPVEKFKGFTASNGSNYLDIHHKIGIKIKGRKM